MTKNQITAKAMLTTLGIYAAVTFISSLKSISYRDNPVWLLPLSLCAMIIAVIVFFVIRLLIFKNDFLISKITGPQDQTEDFDQRIYLIKAFRIGFVLLGLLLLCSSRMLSGLAFILRSFSPHSIRMWITDAINMNFNSPKYLLMHILNLFKLCAAIYLLCGAPHIIRWHLKNSGLNQRTEGLKNE